MPLRAGMNPVSTRDAGDMDMSNKVSMASVSLHTDEEDPLQQLLRPLSKVQSLRFDR
mgnify:CR=1 FL=1